MASTIQTKTSRIVTRTARDIDPKIAGVFAVAALTIVVVVVAYLVAALVGKPLDPAIAGYVVPGLLAALVGYLRKSKHADLVDEGTETADELVDAIAPIVEHVAPELAPVVDEIQDGVDEIRKAFTPGPASL